MHIPDGIVSDSLSLAAMIGSVFAVGVSLYKLRKGQALRAMQDKVVPALAALVFAAQMVNFPVGGGTSGHFIGGALAAILLGPSAALVVLTVVLAVQSVAFADGGMTALGLNVLNMGLVGGVLASFAAQKIRGLMPNGTFGFLAAVGMASWASVVLASGACAVELAVSGVSPLAVVLPAMLGTHALIGLGEAAMTVAVVCAVLSVRPDVLPSWAGVDQSVRKVSDRSFVGASLIVAFAIALFLSPFASAFPDGLEKVAFDNGFASMMEGMSVEGFSPMAGYELPVISAHGLSTAVAGAIGTALVVALASVPALRRRKED